MSIASEIAKMAASAKSESRHMATVLRTDQDGTVWVSIAGGADETFLRGSNVEMRPGDQVEVTIADGRATATGNVTSPSVGMRSVMEAVQPVAESATRALEASEAAAELAREAGEAATATDQHFWSRSTDPDQDGAGTGAFVTDAEREDFLAAAAQGFPDIGEGEGKRPWHNILMNSLGILLRSGLSNLASLTRSGIAFYDGDGNQAGNVLALFGKDGAQIGPDGGSHVSIDSNTINMLTGENALMLSMGLSNNVMYVDAMKMTDSTNNGRIVFDAGETGSKTADLSELFETGGASRAFCSARFNYPNALAVNFWLEPDADASKTIDQVQYDWDAESKTLTIAIDSPKQHSFESTIKWYTVQTLANAPYLLVGSSSSLFGGYASALGFAVSASGNFSFAAGMGAEANGTASFSSNQGLSYGDYSHAEGYGEAYGPYSHAEGYRTRAVGGYAHAEGRVSSASGNYSHAQNLGTNASSENQTALGKYNVVDSDGKYAVIVGNGTDDSNRSDALTVDWDGNVTAGEVCSKGNLHFKSNVGDASLESVTYFVTDANSYSHFITTEAGAGSAVEVGTSTDNGTAAGAYVGCLNICDKNGYWMGRCGTRTQNGSNYAFLGVRNRKADGTDVTNYINLIVDKNGTVRYGLSSPSAFRAALSLGEMPTAVNKTTSVASGSNVNVATMSLPAGTWMVCAKVQFPSNSTGRRAVKLSTVSGDSGNVVSTNAQAAVDGGSTHMSTSRCFRLTATTNVYVIAWQNSGTALSCIGDIEATRIG